MPSAYEDEVTAWRAARLARLTSETGWLAIVGRFDLHEGKNAIPAVGEVVLERGMATFEGHRLIESHPIAKGTLRLELLVRSDGPALRVKDTASARRLGFAGIEHYPIDLSWRKIARFERFEAARSIELDYRGAGPQRFEAPGVCVFEHQGRTFRLEPVLDPSEPRLFVLFRDATNRDETYGAGRFLYATLPDGDRTVLDFNLAYSPPCAFNPWVSCPLAPPSNRLDVRVEAGEKSPRAQVDGLER
jgi:uncharacterized protein (DUF1684 family)